MWLEKCTFSKGLDRIQAYDKRCKLATEESYVPRQMIYLHLKGQQITNKTKHGKNNTHVSTV